MRRRQTLVSLAAVSLAGIAFRSRIAAAMVNGDSPRDTDLCDTGRASVHTNRNDGSKDAELEHRLRNCLRTCGKFCERIQQQHRLSAVFRSSQLISSCQEAAGLCRQALVVTSQPSGQSPAFWQACADSCHRFAVYCSTREVSLSEAADAFHEAHALCSAMIV